MPYDLADKRVLVTGASSGIGAALAEGFARRGAVVGICARRTDRLAEVLDRVRVHSPASRMWTVDLADLGDIAAFAASVVEGLGGVDVLVNNAGIPKRRSVQDLDAATVERVMRIDYLSPVSLTLALLDEIVRRSGRIVNVSSVAARLSPPGEAAYAAAKAAVSAWSESLQVDLLVAGHDARVHVVNPGVVDTELFTLPDNDPFTAGIDALDPEVVVDAVLGQLESGAFEIYVPEWFGDVVKVKVDDIDGYLAGAAEFARQTGAPPGDGSRSTST